MRRNGGELSHDGYDLGGTLSSRPLSLLLLSGAMKGVATFSCFGLPSAGVTGGWHHTCWPLLPLGKLSQVTGHNNRKMTNTAYQSYEFLVTTSRCLTFPVPVPTCWWRKWLSQFVYLSILLRVVLSSLVKHFIFIATWIPHCRKWCLLSRPILIQEICIYLYEIISYFISMHFHVCESKVKEHLQRAIY